MTDDKRTKKLAQRGAAVSGQRRVPPGESEDTTSTTIDSPTFDERLPIPPVPRRGFDPSAGSDDHRRTAQIAREEVTKVHRPSRSAPSDDHVRTTPIGQEPMRAISMKTPEAVQEKAARPRPEVRLEPRSSDLAPPQPVGRLAPPRDPREARSRQLRDVVVWGSLAVILASIVTLVIWLIAGR